jgi:hypothetical protein
VFGWPVEVLPGVVPLFSDDKDGDDAEGATLSGTVLSFSDDKDGGSTEGVFA